MNDVNACLLDAADVERVCIDKLHDYDAKNVFVVDVVGHENFGKATQKVSEGSGTATRRVVGGEELEEVVANCRILFIQDSVGGSVDKDVGRDHASQRNNLAGEFESVRHGKRIGMAWHRNYVLGAESVGLFDDFPADLGESEPVGSGIELFEAPGVLNGLESYTPDTGLGQSEVDDFADLAVVEALLQGHDKIRRDVMAVEPFERVNAYAAEVGAAKLHEGFPLERVELKINFKIFA